MQFTPHTSSGITSATQVKATTDASVYQVVVSKPTSGAVDCETLNQIAPISNDDTAKRAGYYVTCS